jgi:hypothetical protein
MYSVLYVLHACLLCKVTALLHQLTNVLPPLQNYFGVNALTEYYYWIGVKRAGTGAAYEYSSTPPELPQAVSNAPYAHWSWYHTIANRSSGYDCVIAQQAFKFELFIGDTNNSAHVTDSRYYNTNPANKELAYGWNGYPCVAKLHAVCEVHASRFPCMSPMPPPQAPPGPPPPPRPPAGSGMSGGGWVDSCEQPAC